MCWWEQEKKLSNGWKWNGKSKWKNRMRVAGKDDKFVWRISANLVMPMADGPPVISLRALLRGQISGTRESDDWQLRRCCRALKQAPLTCAVFVIIQILLSTWRAQGVCADSRYLLWGVLVQSFSPHFPIYCFEQQKCKIGLCRVIMRYKHNCFCFIWMIAQMHWNAGCIDIKTDKSEKSVIIFYG